MIQGIVIYGNQLEQKDKASTYLIEDYKLAENREEQAKGILNPRKATKKKLLLTQEIENSLGINVLPGEILSIVEKDNKKLRRKL